MKKIIFFTAIAVVSFSFIFSGCSNSEEPKPVSPPTEQERNEIADEITHRIQDPIDKARALKTDEDARVEEQAQMVEE